MFQSRLTKNSDPNSSYESWNIHIRPSTATTIWTRKGTELTSWIGYGMLHILSIKTLPF